MYLFNVKRRNWISRKAHRLVPFIPVRMCNILLNVSLTNHRSCSTETKGRHKCTWTVSLEMSAIVQGVVWSFYRTDTNQRSLGMRILFACRSVWSHFSFIKMNSLYNTRTNRPLLESRVEWCKLDVSRRRDQCKSEKNDILSLSDVSRRSIIN